MAFLRKLREQGKCYDCFADIPAAQIPAVRCGPCRYKLSKKKAAARKQREKSIDELYIVPSGPVHPPTTSAWGNHKSNIKS